MMNEYQHRIRGDGTSGCDGSDCLFSFPNNLGMIEIPGECNEKYPNKYGLIRCYLK